MKCIAILALVVAAVCIAEISGDCVPGMVFKQECNTCHCSPDGKVAACTLMLCNTDTLLKSNAMCEAGTVWKKECNTCICTSNGVGICTAMACL